MKFNLAIKEDRKRAFSYFVTLANRRKIVEVKKISPGRTLSQNSYLHLLLGYFGQHFGYTLDEAKQIYKELNPSIYSYDKKGRSFTRSSADLTTEEMTISIDHFREKSKEQGFPLPAATDKGWLLEIEKEIERSNYYLRKG